MKTLFTILRISFITILICFAFNGQSNNVKIDSDPIIINTDADNDFSNIQFDMSWDNSWRDATNWDAVWVFVKYRVGAGNWQQAYLSTNAMNHTVGSNNGVAPAFAVGTTNISGNDRGMGVFIYRNANGTGNINWDQVNLRWNYGENGVADGDQVTIKVFAIEMVYVPLGSFYVGDGVNVAPEGRFSVASSTVTPFQITSENALTLGGLVAGNLGNNNATGMATADDYNNAVTQTLPAAFPKGFAAFYCMKYEVSQEEYVDFLNTLTRTQQVSRVGTNIAVGVSSVTNRYVMATAIAMFKRNGIRCDAAIDPNNPVTFYCDFNGNSVPNENGDGQTIAMNMITFGDQVAYTDWAGLRPMTELEFEKACRGTVIPIANEGPWGTNVVTSATSILNGGLENETGNPIAANCNVNNALLPNDNINNGPMRCGAFSTAISTRTQSGASYYGIMDLAGNLWDRIVTTGHANGRSFTGLHGDGSLDGSGNADVSLWPANNALGSGFRGAAYAGAAGQQRWNTSSRQAASSLSIIRASTSGFRCVRTAP